MAEGRRYEGFVPGRFRLEAYGNGGFRFADMSHRGSILVLPSGIKAWHVSAPETLSTGDFADVVAEAASIELLLVGTGNDLMPLREALRRKLREAGMSVEVMPTGAAARTYNVLLAEDRHVAAALIAVD
ncbi:Mth938-like domain-containing protein [Chelatococcus sp. GCM10030263]|uniref:Mth938-like domain-containing protein n=1 Tax=Chelatococcus sp. GCM10030263 TaxID=3273387 RepID=UPI00360D84A3